jgi:hypothetical protein
MNESENRDSGDFTEQHGGGFCLHKPIGAATTDPQEWTEETVVDFILDAFESAGETRAIKLISERHNAALDAERQKRADWNVVIEDLERELAAEREKRLEVETQLQAWQQSFGTTQLTHALAKVKEGK